MSEDNNISAEELAIELLGKAQPVTKQSKKKTITSFRYGNLFFSLKAVYPYNKEIQDYDKPILKVVFLCDGKYVRIPFDPALFANFGEFLTKLSVLVKDVKQPEQNNDVEHAKEMIESIFGGKS